MSDLNACLLARFAGHQPPDWLRRWLDDGLGGVLLFASNIAGPEQLRALAAELRSHNPRVLIAADEEGGGITRLEARAGSSYPGNAALGAVDDTGLTGRVAASMGAMLAQGGVNLDFAPVADVDANPANPIIGVRSFGAEPGRVAAHTAAFVTGLQSHRVAACAKHFPGHGRTDADSHLALPVVGVSVSELRRTDLVPFRAAIGAGVRAIMTAHVVFPEIDAVPATTSRRLLHGLLREELGFGGVIVTDALEMAAIGDSEASADGAVRSLAAGADLLCLPPAEAAQRLARASLQRAVRDGVVPAARVEESAARVRELAGWARADPADPAGPAGPPEPAVGAEAARRALLAEAARLPPGVPPFVLDAGGRMSSELADTTGNLLGVLRRRDPGVDGVRVSELPAGPGELDAMIARAAGRPLVLAVRDAHRRPWQRELVGRVLAGRPDAVVVGTGTAADRHLAGRSYLGTRGCGRVNLEAAADVLLAAGPGGEPAR
jgi:beta-N-acetylhexosaminidase